MKIISWNVNGIRAVYKKGLPEWIAKELPDILCLQETKAAFDQFPKELTELPDFEIFHSSAIKKGYSGVATFSREKILDTKKSEKEVYDDEGRVLIHELEHFFLVNCYFPNGSRDFTYLSPGCEAILGVNRELLLNGTYPMQSFIHHEDWDQFSDLFESSIATEKLFIWEGRIIASEKNIKWIEVTGQPVRLEGVKIGWSGVMSDISERKELEQKQKESDVRYRTLVDSLPLGMGIHQKDKLVYAKEYAAKMLEASSVDQLIGKSVLDFVHPEELPAVKERMKSVMMGQPISGVKERFVTLGGKEIFVETSALPFIFFGQPAVQLILRDVTEQTKEEEK